jgi:hypothetical protein
MPADKREARNDVLLRENGDWAKAIVPVAEEESRNDVEEARVAQASMDAGEVNEPGEEYPEPEPPPADEPHDEYDPTPPPA